jgi:Xaa-Pro aminopeptidase
MHGFSPAIFHRRRSTVLARLGSGTMVLPSAPRLYRAGDSELPYRPDSELFYLTGWTEPDAVLVLRGFADEARCVLFVAPRDPAAEQWTGVRMGPAAAAEALGLPPGDVRPLERLAVELPGLLLGADLVHARLGEARGLSEDVGALALRGILSALALARARGSKTGTGPRGVVDPGGILDELRLVKDPEEVVALREAARASMAGFEALFDGLVTGLASEAEAEAELLRAFRRAGASGPSYAPIVAGGVNACILHYAENRAPLRSGDLLLVDAGAEVRLYAGDITRTVPVSGRFTPPQRDLYQVVEAARASAVEACRPGRTLASVHEAASRALLRGLVELGVLRGDPELLLAQGVLQPFFPHRTSHWLGLNTHDPGDQVVGGAPRILEAGMVLTVEPGLYLPPEGLFGGAALPQPDLAEAFRGLGIRIEDDILVTDQGPENLTAALPTDPDALEARLSGLQGG